MSKALLKSLNGLVSLVVAVALITAGLYAGYALWDNKQIYSAAEGVQNELMAFKPKVVSDDGGEVEPSFDELLEINPDVCAWVTLDNTAIDHVVLQGETNLTYINTDVYKHFALAGSIFLDSRCDRTFAGNYNLLYGHHMVNHGMFGDLDLYKDEKFFEENDAGTLMTPGVVHPLQILACIVTEASDDAIFEPDDWSEKAEELLDGCLERALHVRPETVELIEAMREAELEVQILALSTCSSEYTNARTILLTVMDPPQIAEDGTLIPIAPRPETGSTAEDAGEDEPAEDGDAPEAAEETEAPRIS